MWYVPECTPTHLRAAVLHQTQTAQGTGLFTLASPVPAVGIVSITRGGTVTWLYK